MLAEWISRGAGDRDSRELLAALDNLGVSHGESAQTLHTSIAAATLGRNLIPALEIFADVVLRPHLDDDEVEPIRALALQNLRSLEDDPGTKVIYELRKRHFPDPWGRPAPGTPEGVAAPDARRPAARSTASAYRPNGAILGVAGAIDWPALRDAVGRLFGDWEPRPEPSVAGAARPGPSRDHILRETQQIQIALAYPIGHRRQPRLLPRPRRHGDPRRLLVGPALHRGPREARALLLGLRQLREPARPRGRPLLRRHLARPGAGDPRRHPRRDRPPRHATGIERRGARDHARGPEELADHAAGIEHEPLGLARLRLVLPRPRPLARRDLRRARRPDPRVGQRLRRAARTCDAMTILTLGPNRLGRQTAQD